MAGGEPAGHRQAPRAGATPRGFDLSHTRLLGIGAMVYFHAIAAPHDPNKNTIGCLTSIIPLGEGDLEDYAELSVL